MRFIISLILIQFVSHSFSQRSEYEVRKFIKGAPEDKLLNENSVLLLNNQYYLAEIVVDKLLQINPESANYNYRKGFILLDSKNDWINALPYFLKASGDLDENFDMFSISEKSAPTDALYHIARCYHLDLQIDKAREFYKRFIIESNSNSELIPKAKLGLQQCNIAQRLIETPRSAKVINIGKKINSANPEYSPVISLDGSALYFTSRRQWDDNSSDEYKDPSLNQFPEDIYLSYRDFNSNQWQEPQRLSFCDPKFNEATVSISADERRIYTYEDKTGNGDIYFADYSQSKFRNLSKLPYNKVNTEYWETHCTATSDGFQIYFVSDRPGGIGGRDIYRLSKLPDGSWSEPYNLGPTINTPYDEDSPFIGVDNKTLYFSSNGPLSMGGFDVFISVKDQDDKWSFPINMGFPINSSGDDIFYTTTADGSRGYLSSFRKDGLGEKDIYEIHNDASKNNDLVILKASILPSDHSPIPENITALVTCTSCGQNAPHELQPRVRDGLIVDQLDPCQDYVISFKRNSESDILYSEKFSTRCEYGYQEVKVEAILDVDRNLIFPVIDYQLEIKISDKKTNEIIPNATVLIKDIKSGNLIEKIVPDASGKLISNLLKGAFPGKKISYEVVVSKEKYITQSFEWNELLDTIKNHTLSYKLESLNIGIDLAKTLELNPIYFDLNKSAIRPDAKVELDRIVKAMNDNPSIEIELGSHTDCRSSQSYNSNLSEKRAKASAEYIKSRITNPNRITGKGYGESQLVNECACEGPVKSSCSEDQHQANRRTEFKIVKY
jgi:outer membrane protein OmpA-like peptidoglycan-associated protein